MPRFILALTLAMRLLLADRSHGAEYKFDRQTLTVPDGFEVELVAGPPLVDRPMMADFDEQGRLYVADSSGSNVRVDQQLLAKPHRIVRLEDTDGDGRFDRSVVFADQLMFPEGVLWLDGAVYTGAPPTLWKLEDTDDDGVADRRTEWHQGKTLTGCANDLHGPYLGPDGWIYWCKGAFAKQTYERPGRRTIADSAAHVFRARPDHNELDSVMSGGMDNPIELAWTPEGEQFFITTFFHHPEAGRRDAIAHCVYGGVYPKPHGVLDDVQKTGDLLPPLVELGPAAACGLTRYESRAFGPEFEGNLFSTLFNLRKVMRHVLQPDGATYQSKNSDFLVSDNPDFHPTDVFEDADGSLLVIDTGGWYKICCPTSQLAKPDVLGAIYRVRRQGAPRVDDPRGLKFAWAAAKAADLAPLLEDARPAVRERAIRQLAKQGATAVPALTESVQHGRTAAQRRNAVWALTRIDGPAARPAVRLALADADETVRRVALHAVGLHRDAAALPELIGCLRTGSPFVQRKAAEALGRLGDAAAVAALLEAAARLGTQAGDSGAGIPTAPTFRIQEHAILYALIEIARPDATRAGLEAASPWTRRAALVALDQMDAGGLKVDAVAPLLLSPDPVLKQTAAWIASHHPEWGKALAGFFQQRLAAADLSGRDAQELKRQLTQFGRDAALQELIANAAGNPTLPRANRNVALGVMAAAGLKEMPTVWLAVLPRCLGDANEEIVQSAILVTHSLPAPKTNTAELTAALLRLARDPGRSLAQRIDALRGLPGALAPVEPEVFRLLLQGLEVSLPPTVRSGAAAVLAKAKLTDDQLLALAAALEKVGPMELNRLLEAFENATGEAVGRQFVASLKESKALPSVRVDLLRQRLAKFPPAVQQAGAELLARLDVDPAKQAAHLDSLLAELKRQGGDIRRGQAIFNSTKTACVTCHALGYLGGKVGPDLTSIGQIRTERDLLEAVVYPSASFVRSYEPVIATTKDDEEFSGVVLNETAEEIVLATGADTTARLAKNTVKEMRPGAVSVMPAGLTEQLSKQDLADLLVFLRNTKSGPQ